MQTVFCELKRMEISDVTPGRVLTEGLNKKFPRSKDEEQTKPAVDARWRSRRH